jgi:hypothetical protein
MQLAQTRRKLLVVVPYTGQADLDDELAGVLELQSETPGSELPSIRDRAETLEELLSAMRGLGVRIFRGARDPDIRRTSQECEAMFHSSRPWVDTLPDCWIYFDKEAAADIVDATSPKLATIENHLEPWVDSRIARQMEFEKEVREQHPSLRTHSRSKFEELLQKRHLRIVKVSGASFNPRFRGLEISEPREALRVLAHAVLALRMSTPLASSG